jgi:hypothetical protein
MERLIVDTVFGQVKMMSSFYLLSFLVTVQLVPQRNWNFGKIQKNMGTRSSRPPALKSGRHVNRTKFIVLRNTHIAVSSSKKCEGAAGAACCARDADVCIIFSKIDTPPS